VFTQSKTIVAMSGDTATDLALIINGDDGYGRVRPHIWVNGWVYHDGSTILSPNRWYHIVMTYDGSFLRSYVDGVNDGTLSYTGNIRISGFPLLIGRYGNPHSTFRGMIDDVRIYNRALSTTEIQQLYHEDGY